MKPSLFARWLALGSSLACLSLPAQSTPGAGPLTPPVPGVHGSALQRGQDAINRLAGRLPDVARAHGMEARSLHLRLLTDASLALDPSDRLLFTCAGPAATSTAPAAGAVSAGVPLTDTFVLHSRPGASKVIYLDFTGHTTTGTPWNSNFSGGANIVTPPYDFDGNNAAFSDAELLAIQGIWQRVTEDFAPFEVDVTTEDPGVEALRRTTTADAAYGVRVCIGGSSFDWYGGSAGGVAYVGSFTWNTDSPAFVFTAQLGNGNEKYTAEAASHEAGHTLGLSHDGTTTGSAYYQGHGSGATGWAPIMGSGYYRPVTQWSRGEYANANNTEDDLAIIQSYVAYRADDHGNTGATATFEPAGSGFVDAGTIERNTDVDVFAFSTRAGAISLSVVPDDRSPNLDLLLELRDAAGSLVASSNPDTLSASLSLTVPDGTYFAHVRGTGFADPASTGYSPYASLGGFIFSGTVVDPSGSVAPVAVIAATPLSGTAPLLVSFSGAGSFDTDGTLVSYDWAFGDGTTGTGVQPTKTYTAVGTYTAQLTVTDNDGLTATSSQVIEVLAPNINPIAVLSTTATSGTAPLAVTFSGSGSSDPDGSISAYSWNFGDGTTATGMQVGKTYGSTGTYLVTLTVTDNRGGTSSATTTIVVTANLALKLRVQSIQMSLTQNSRGKAVLADVLVTDLNGLPVPNVTVSGRWSGLVKGNTSGTTASTGLTQFTSSRFKTTGSVSFTITGLSRSGYTYNSADNLQSSASILAASLP